MEDGLTTDKLDTEFDGGEAEVLESTAGPIWDTWSSQVPILTEGGGRQYQIIGTEKEKVKSTEKIKIENMLTEIENNQKTTLTYEKIELLYKHIYASTEKGKFAISRNLQDSVNKEIANIERIGQALRKISYVVYKNKEDKTIAVEHIERVPSERDTNFDLLKDFQNHAIEILRENQERVTMPIRH